MLSFWTCSSGYFCQYPLNINHRMSFSQKNKARLFHTYGSWALVTGASSGIGKEIATRLAEAGFHLVLTARRSSLLESLSQDLQKRYATKTRIVQADLSQSAHVQKLIQESKGLDIGLLVANAGFGTSGSFLEADLSQEINMLDVNCKALLQLTHHFSQAFVQKGKGGIILMSSMVSFQGVPFAAHYAATKAYVQSLAEALAVELAPHGVDVLAAAPGPVLSGFSDRANMKMGNVLRPEDVGIPILNALGRRHTALPGLLTKVLVYSLRTVPRWAKIRIMKQVMGGMTQHQQKELVPA